MISVELVDENSCVCCNKRSNENEKLLKIYFTNKLFNVTTSTIVYLCEKCSKELKEKL